MRGGVWGASGPILGDEHEGKGTSGHGYGNGYQRVYGHDLDDDEDREEEVRARPLTGPVSFFKSSSPLDDLFVTFAWTRWMVRPIWRGREERAWSDRHGEYEKC